MHCPAIRSATTSGRRIMQNVHYTVTLVYDAVAIYEHKKFYSWSFNTM